MRYILALLACLFASAASAQNVTCSTRPIGDNSNACASTAFVHSSVPSLIPPPTPTTLGGIFSTSSVAHQWLRYCNTTGTCTQSQPDFTDISGSVATTQMPSFSGGCTSSSGTTALTCPSPDDAMVGAGDFDIWDEGNSFSSPTTGTYVADLWKVLYDGTAGTFTISQYGGPLSAGAGNGLEWDQTIAGSGSTYRLIQFNLEDASQFNGQTVTLSFYATASANTTVTAGMAQYFGSGGTPSPEVTVGSQSFTVTTTPTLYTWTVAVPSTAGKTFGTNFNDYLKIQFYLPVTSTFDVRFQQVKLNRGTVANWYQVPLYAKHAFINRYLQFIPMSMGSTASAAGQYIYTQIPFRAQMRAVPSITVNYALLPGAGSANLGGSGIMAATSVVKYGGTMYIQSAASGAFYDIGRLIRLDARF